ncbi:MAG: adenosylcobinamide-GDP ribazoletransferase [Hyphomicrobiales bacterium]|nr:adenosylcobinamide-GDP ribazoletransferase [Hyphomicrobiales bacterium]
MKQLQKLKADTLLALQFFSVVHLPSWLQPEINNLDKDDHPPKLNEAAVGFPIAGFLIGVPLALMWITASHFVSPVLAATLTIALGALITGCLHEDGLADCFDGLGGASNRERILDIMRDSAIGTYGAAALFFSFALRIGALASLSSWRGALALLFAHSVARGSMVLAIHFAQYARPAGLADTVRDGIGKDDFYKSMAVMFMFAVLLSIASDEFSGIVAVLSALIAAWVLLQWLISRIGGYTGDGLGAMEQVAEIAILITLAVLWA